MDNTFQKLSKIRTVILEKVFALSEASFCEVERDKELDVDSFISILQKRLKVASDKIFSKSKK